MTSVVFSLLAFVVWPSPSRAVDAKAIADRFGTYRGISYTAESDTGVGEVAVTIDANEVVIRLATGRGVKETRRSIADLVPIPPAERSAEFSDGDDAHRFEAYRMPEGYPHFYFLTEAHLDPAEPGANEFALFILNEDPADAVGPTVLFSTAHTDPATCDELLGAVNPAGMDAMPRLPPDEV